jgi:hypothetical protein
MLWRFVAGKLSHAVTAMKLFHLTFIISSFFSYDVKEALHLSGEEKA